MPHLAGLHVDYFFTGACLSVGHCDHPFTGARLSVGSTPPELTSRQECARARDSCVALVPRTSSASRSIRLAADLPDRSCPPAVALLPFRAPMTPSEEPA